MMKQGGEHPMSPGQQLLAQFGPLLFILIVSLLTSHDVWNYQPIYSSQL